MKHDTIAVLDYGSQYSQLICRRVREANVYAEMISWDRGGRAAAAGQAEGYYSFGRAGQCL